MSAAARGRHARAAWHALAVIGVLSTCAALLSAQPPRLRRAGTLPILADAVELSGTTAYIASGKTFSIFDVRDGSAPKRLGAHTFPEEIWSFRLQGTTAYVGVNFFGLGILDVADPAAPTLRGSFKTPGQAKTGAAWGGRAVVIDHMEGLVAVDVSNPAKPAAAGSFFLDGYARDVVAAGPLAFAVDSPTGFYVFDLSRPGPIEPIASLQTGTALRTVDIVEGSPRLAVLVGGGTLQIYDVSNPAAPVKGATLRTPGGAQRVAVKDRVAYVADGQAGLQLVDLSNPAAPAIIGSYATSSPARDVAVDGRRVLVAVGGGSVEIWEVE